MASVMRSDRAALPEAGNGRPPVGLQRMLRMYFAQHWFKLADEACEEALLDSTALRRFVSIERSRERVPNGTTLLKFRGLLETHKAGRAAVRRGRPIAAGALLEGGQRSIGTPPSSARPVRPRTPTGPAI